MKPLCVHLATTAYGYRDSGIRYEQEDCQAFVEHCLSDIGVKVNYRGSNDMWRNACYWRGTPEECRVKFGKIPAGALLFIWANDGGEPSRYHGDGEGNASHVGIFTALGKGAMHSSKSKGGVCESAFSGKSINGGWNRVGLCKLLDYGEKYETEDHTDDFDATDMGNLVFGQPVPTDTGVPEQDTQQMPQESTGHQMMVWADNGRRVNMRKQPGTGYTAICRLDVGTLVIALETQGDWTKIKYGGKTGWMMNDFLKTVEEVYGIEDTADEPIDDIQDDVQGIWDPGADNEPVSDSLYHPDGQPEIFEIETTAPRVRIRTSPDMSSTRNVVRVVERKGSRLKSVGTDAETGWYLLTDGNYISNEFVRRV